MNVYQVIKYIFAAGLLIGGVFYIVREKSRLGEKFKEAFMMAGQMILSIAGIMTIAPVLANIIAPVITPFFKLTGADPSVISIFFGCDMGGYSIAVSLCTSPEVAKMMGLTAAGMMGSTLIFSIPVGKAMLSDEDFKYFSKGMLMGLIAIPIGSIICGFIQGLDIKTIFINNLFLILVAVLLIIGFKFVPDALVKGADIFGRAITKIGLVGLVAGGITYLTGITIIPGMPDVMEAMETVSGMLIVLAGTMPLLELFSRALKKPLEKLGAGFGLDAVSMSGILFTLASVIPAFAMMKNMKKRGIIINGAWSTTIVGILGSQIGFVMQEAPDMAAAFLISKIAAGFVAVAIAFIATSKEYGKKASQAQERVEGV